MVAWVRSWGFTRTSGRFTRFAIIPVLLSLVAGCGGGGSSSGGGGGSSPTITLVSVSCAPTSIQIGQTSPCTVTVTGTGNYSSAVTWSVNGTSGGSATYGSINTSGLYQAPTTVPSPAVIQISATSVQDSTKSGSTQLSVVLKITVAPLTPSVQLFHPEQFNATVQGVSNTAVTWAVNGIAGGNSNVGQISNTGLYTPPAVLPSPATVTVSAHSQADSTQSASTSAILVADTTALDVVSISPVSNATGVSSQTAVSVVFNEAINPSTIGPGSITLGEGKTTIPLQFSYNASSYTLTLTPLVLLDPLTVVTLSIAPQLQDLGGNSVASTYSSTFTTAGPTSISGTVTPPNGVSANSLSEINDRHHWGVYDKHFSGRCHCHFGTPAIRGFRLNGTCHLKHRFKLWGRNATRDAAPFCPRISSFVFPRESSLSRTSNNGLADDRIFIQFGRRRFPDHRGGNSLSLSSALPT